MLLKNWNVFPINKHLSKLNDNKEKIPGPDSALILTITQMFEPFSSVIAGFLGPFEH